MMKDFTIQPLKGYGEIPFGMTLDDTVKLLNMPDFYEELNDMEETGNRSIYYEYDDIQTNIYFEGITKSVVACFETENEAATLFGKKVFDLKKEDVVKLMKDNGFKDFIIVQFTGGQSPLTQAPNGDWSKVPYDYMNEPLKRHYPVEKATEFCKLYHEKHPKTAIVNFGLPNEPCPDLPYIVKTVVPYLAWYELAKFAKEIVCIDSSLQHLTAGLVKTTVIWGHSKPENFGYSFNKNIEQPCRTDDLLYFTALGPSGAKVEYIEPAELLREVDECD